MENTPIDFLFDFTSPYSYLMSEKIEALAHKHGRSIRWRPILLGVVFKTVGSRPLTEAPLKGEYSRRDFARSARFLNVPFTLPDPFPLGMLAPSRACYFLQDHFADLVPAFVHEVFRGYFVRNERVDQPENTWQCALRAGFAVQSQSELMASLQEEHYKNVLREATQTALNEGVFGAPFVVIDGEPFWGVDRLEQMDRWLAEGSF